MAFCAGCGSVIPSSATTCPRCGRKAAAKSLAGSSIPDMFSGPLAYLFFPAILFLVLNPYKQNRFVRFHSLQSILFFTASVVLLGMILFTGVLAILIGPVVAIGLFVIWVVLVIKAYQQEMWKIPYVGLWVERLSSF